MRKNREKRGSIDFDFPESKLILDETGYPVEIKAYERNAATKLIEEFMLLANETVAEHFYWLDIPFLYRSHESPEQEKIKKLSFLMRNMGFCIKTGREEIHPKEIQKLLWQADGSESEALVSRLALRSMRQARYTSSCVGHFGLASRYYCHFTSPIRRYPDLQIHRIIKQHLREKLDEDRQEHYREILDAVAAQCSMTKDGRTKRNGNVKRSRKRSIWKGISERAFRAWYPASIPSGSMWNWKIRWKGLYQWAICRGIITDTKSGGISWWGNIPDGAFRWDKDCVWSLSGQISN